MKTQYLDIEIERNQTLDTLLSDILNQSLVEVNAEAGSLMLVANKPGILQIKARLGKPQPGRKTSPVYKLDRKGIASWVVQHKEPYLCNDVSVDPNFVPSRCMKENQYNFYSLLSAPVIYDGKVIAVINADSMEKNHFSEEDKRRLMAVANKVAVAMHERISIVDALGQIGVEISRLAGMGNSDIVLEKIAELAKRSLGADIVTLYEYDQASDTFPVEGTGPTIAGAFNISGEMMKRRVFPGDVPWTLVHERNSGFYSHVNEQEFLRGEVHRPGDPPRPRFIERENIKSMAALLIPYRATEEKDQEVVGVMFVNYRKLHEFNIDEISALATFADYAAVAISNTRLEEKRSREQVQIIQNLLATFAHRMASLAGISRFNVQILEEIEHIKNDVEALQLLKEIKIRSDVLLNLAKRLKPLFQENALKISRESVNVENLLREENERIQISTGIRPELKISGEIPNIISLEFQLREVLYDVLNNALEAIHDKSLGKIREHLIFDSVANKVILEISDNGIGMNKELKKKLFTLGTTTKFSLGIGLWWSKTFLNSFGADIFLKKSIPEKGTTFQIELPCATQPKKEKGKIDILVVDDDETFTKKLTQIIKGPYSITQVSDYSKAAALLNSHSVRLAILDICLADMDRSNRDGLRLLEYIEKNKLATKVVYISGNLDEYQSTIDKRSNVIAAIDKSLVDIQELRLIVNKSLS